MLIVADPISNDLGHHYHYNKKIYTITCETYHENIKFMSSDAVVKYVKGDIDGENDVLKSVNKKGFFSKLTNRITIFQNYKKVLNVAKKYKNQNIIFTGFEEISFYLFYILNRNTFRNTRIAIILHNNIATSLDSGIKKFFLYKTLSIVDLCIVHEEFQKKLLLELFGQHILSKILVLKNVIEKKINETKMKKLGSPIKVYFLGSTTKYKGFEILLQAIRELPEEIFTHVKIGIYGKISCELEQEVQKFKYRIDIKNQYLSESEYNNYLNEAHFIILPYTAAFKGRISGVFYDAVSCLTPVICSDIEVYDYYFKKFGEIGFQFRSNSSKELANIFIKLSKLEDIQYHKMQEDIKLFAKEYSKQRVINNMNEILKNVLYK